MNYIIKKYLSYIAVCMFSVSYVNATEYPKTQPDFTQGNIVDRELTYNLGSSGLRGWIFTKAASNLDSEQGRTTTLSRQILVTHVGVNSPADGVIEVDDVILGVNGKLFVDDARKSIATAIQEAEKTENKGLLTLMIWRSGMTKDLVIKLRVMGDYSATAPYDCEKSKLIFQEACKALDQEPLVENWRGAVNGLALLATGDSQYLPKLRELAHRLGPQNLKLELKSGSVVWDWGYKNLFLCEYFLLTGDTEVMHAIEQFSTVLAKGQSMYGTFGHGISDLTNDGKLHGSIPPYGPVNAAGLIGNIAIIMGKKCGLKDPEIDPAIERASKFFSYYVDKGAIPYGEHLPWGNHDNNGKNSMAAVMFALQGDKLKETQYFAKMVTASYQNREYGHTGQGFSYLWGAIGANFGGAEAAAAFFKEASWHFDLVRRCDGSFTYDGGEQYGPGKTNDNTYYGKSGYNELSPNAIYVLTYSLPLKKICLTGRDVKPESSLNKIDIAEAIASGRFDLTRKSLNANQLIEAFGDWSPIVRGWAAEELGKRPDSVNLISTLISMAEGPDAHKRQGAVEALGYIQDPAALPLLVRLLAHEDRWLRVKAAVALKKMNGKAKLVIPEILKAVADTVEPGDPVTWADPAQLAHVEIADTLFKGLLGQSIAGIDSKLIYPAFLAVVKNPNGMARATLTDIVEKHFSEEDVKQLAPDLLEAIMVPCSADTMYRTDIRMSAFLALSKYHYKEAINAGVFFAKNQGGHGSQWRTEKIVNIIANYGSAAHDAIPGLNELIVTLDQQVGNNEFPLDLNLRRTNDVKNAIAHIEAATTQPEMKTIGDTQH
jgi:HEAT repeat protein